MVLKGADLSGSKLRGMDYRLVDLSDVLFLGCDLSRAVLASADLSGANLTGATLEGADLKNLILQRPLTVGDPPPDGSSVQFSAKPDEEGKVTCWCGFVSPQEEAAVKPCPRCKTKVQVG
jgi:hypothetical protein